MFHGDRAWWGWQPCWNSARFTDAGNHPIGRGFGQPVADVPNDAGGGEEYR